MNATRNLNATGKVSSLARRVLGATVLPALLACAVGAARPELGEREDEFRMRAQLDFDRTLRHHQANTNNVRAAWNFGRAAYDLADFATNKTERESLANQGVVACRRALNLEPDSAPAHYYLALNLGQLARVHLLKGLGIVAEMERLFHATRRLDPLFDYAGADRALGLLYHQAPGWPISLGNRTKAGRHLRDAVRLQPQYPGNRLALAEYLQKTGPEHEFTTEWTALIEMLPGARTEFTGREWDSSWCEWNHRIAQLRASDDR